MNLSKWGIGGSLGRKGLRIGVDANRRKYFSVGLPGTGLSSRAFFGRRVRPETVRMLVLVGFGILCLVALMVSIQKN
jgi:hypothetical protein